MRAMIAALLLWGCSGSPNAIAPPDRSEQEALNAAASILDDQTLANGMVANGTPPAR